MIFMCCHPSLTPENSLTLILKTLCGLSFRRVRNSRLLIVVSLASSALAVAGTPLPPYFTTLWRA